MFEIHTQYGRKKVSPATRKKVLIVSYQKGIWTPSSCGRWLTSNFHFHSTGHPIALATPLPLDASPEALILKSRAPGEVLHKIHWSG
jgi:hypothetical protein